MSAREMLVQLGARRLHVWADGDHLRYKGPKRAITPDLRGALLRAKPGLLKLLSRADGFLGMTLRQFEKARCSLEVQVTGLDRSLWFVSGPDEVKVLRAEGVPRGRIWTAEELRRLLAPRNLSHEDALAMARTKVTFNAELIDSDPRESD